MREEKIKFDDGSEMEISEIWKQCIKIKYDYGWKQYWIEFADLVTKLWEEGVVLTKFGRESIDGYCEDFGETEQKTRAWHAEECIYADLRSCLMAKAFEKVGGKKVISVIGIGEDKVRVYKGDKMKEYNDISEALGK